ncbi:hypothetical protein G8O24_43890 [Bradyrhizobium sp. INPA01-394B]|nr:hypothetical protein [Bradyrhizobium campsiandrae]
MQLHLDHMPGWDGTCEVRAFATPGVDSACEVNAKSGVAADDFLGLDEGAIDDAQLPVDDPHPRT